MNNVEERVAFLEGRVEGHSVMINDIRETAARLEARFDRLEAKIDQRFTVIDQRFAAVDARFAGIDARLDRMSGQLSSLIIGVAIAAISGLLGMISALFR